MQDIAKDLGIDSIDLNAIGKPEEEQKKKEEEDRK